jgi:hypothetical protein
MAIVAVERGVAKAYASEIQITQHKGKASFASVLSGFDVFNVNEFH